MACRQILTPLVHNWRPRTEFQRCFADGCNQILVASVAHDNQRVNSYYASIDKVLSELELRFSGNDQEILCALGNICHSETPDKESFSRVAKFYKIDGEILEDEQKMYASFRRVRGLSYMTFPEMLETMHENDLLDMLPVFPNAVHILGVIPFTLCFAERSFSVLHRLKTYLRSTMGNNVTVTSHLLTLKGHMPTLQSTMIWIVSLLFSAVKMAKTAIFNVFYELLF